MSLHCTWADMMREAGERLAAAGIEGARRDARLLLAHALGIEPVDVILREMDQVDPVGLTAFEAAVRRRLAHEPVSRIRGWREFYGRRFSVTPDVLDPRPETELLVEQGVKRLTRKGRVLDLGTGSGCILASVLAEREDASGVGLDASEPALEVAKANAVALGVAARAAFVLSGWMYPDAGLFDLALSNPPYIAESEIAGLAPEVREHDPMMALTPGEKPMVVYQAILLSARGWLRPGGWLGFEVGQGQAEAVSELMRREAFEDIEVFSDLAGIPRAVFGRSPGS